MKMRRFLIVAELMLAGLLPSPRKAYQLPPRGGVYTVAVQINDALMIGAYDQ